MPVPPDVETARLRADARATNAQARARYRRPQPIIDVGAEDWAPFTFAVAAGARSFQVAGSFPGRRAVVILNSGANPVFLSSNAGDQGTESVGSTLKLAVGAAVTFTHRATVHCRADADSEITGWIEFDPDANEVVS